METLQRMANRGSVSTGYDIDNSLKFEADNSEYLKWTDISTYATSARKKTFSFSVWFKISELGVQRTIWATAANGYLLLQADGQLKWQQSYGGVVKTLNTNRLFRDTSAWYNVIIAVDSTQSTEANRVRLYVNGVEETSLTSTTYPSQDAEAENVYENHHSLGAYNSSSIFWSGYMANVAFISDAQITPSAVGEVDSDTGIWIPKEYIGGSAPSYFLEFQDSSDLGTATGLDADTLNNIAAADQATDTPTNNFCTLSTLWQYAANTGISEGATKSDGSGAWAGMKATIGISSGKWYWEYKPTSGTYLDLLVGVQTDGDGNIASGNAHNILDTAAFHLDSGTLWIKDSTSGRTDTTYGNVSNSETETYAVALNMDDNQINFYINNTLLTVANQSIDGLSGKVCFPLAAVYNVGVSFNFGGYTTISISSAAADANGYGTFEFAPPSGYYALCTKNLSEFGG